MSARPYAPDLLDLLDATRDRTAQTIRGPMPGRVERYDAATQTADVLPLLRSPVTQPDGSVVFEDAPVVPAVRVLWPRVGAWALTAALVPGDTVLLLPLEGSPGAWLVGDGGVADPEDLRRHHLGSCVALPGLYVSSRALARAAHATGPEGALADTDGAVVLGSDGDAARITLRPSGVVEIAQGSAVVAKIDADGTVHLGGAAGSLVALASLVNTQLTALKSAINDAAVVPNDGGAALKANIMAALASWPSSVAATKVSAV